MFVSRPVLQIQSERLLHHTFNGSVFFFPVKSLIIYSERASQGAHKMVIAGTSLTLNLSLSSSSTRPCEDPALDDWLPLTKQLKPDAC